MKTIKKLGALAALVALSSSALQAVTIDLTTASTVAPTASYTDSGGNTYTGYIWVNPTGWTQTNTAFSPSYSVKVAVTNTQGLGVDSGFNDINEQVDDFGADEFLVIDFGSNYLNKSNFTISVNSFGSGNLSYYWSSSLPTGNTSPDYATVTNGTIAVTSSPQLQGPLSLTGTATQYLILGASPNARYSLAQVSYTQVPDGGLTVTLLGAALGSLGFVGFRRRKV